MSLCKPVPQSRWSGLLNFKSAFLALFGFVASVWLASGGRGAAVSGRRTRRRLRYSALSGAEGRRNGGGRRLRKVRPTRAFASLWLDLRWQCEEAVHRKATVAVIDCRRAQRIFFGIRRAAQRGGPSGLLCRAVFLLVELPKPDAEGNCVEGEAGDATTAVLRSPASPATEAVATKAAELEGNLKTKNLTPAGTVHGSHNTPRRGRFPSCAAATRS